MPEIKTTDYNEAAKPVLKMMTDRIVRNFNPARIILFGSYARGTPNFHSDIDLFVSEGWYQKKGNGGKNTQTVEGLTDSERHNRNYHGKR